MKTLLTNIVLAVLIIAALSACQSEGNNPLSSNQSSISSNNDTYIIVLGSSEIPNLQNTTEITKEYINSVLKSHNIPTINVSAYYDVLFVGCAVTLNDTQLNSLKADKRVESIEKDQIATLNDIILPDSKNDELRLQGQTLPWGITSVGGSTLATSNTGVAWIIDTGIDLDHPELNVDLSLSKTFVTSGQDATTPDDFHGHGSHVSGIIAAKNNADGVVGVCAGATVIAIKCMNMNGSGLLSNLLNGLNYVGSKLIAGKVNVVNMSLTFSASTTLDNAVKALANKGAYICVAAGNSATSSTKYSPARINWTNIFTVSSYSTTFKLSSFSNYDLPVDYSAPGESVYSTYKNGAYATMSGTSMATPHLCGIILANNGTINKLGNITGDKDLYPDPIAKK